MRRACLGIILLALLAVGAVGLHSATAPWATPAPHLAAIPRRPPVLLLIFDEWPVDSLLGPDGRVDAGRYPNIAAFAKTATWYANATTVYDSTTKAVPEILDAKYPRKHTLPNYVDHPQSVFDLFGKHGYKITRQESATSICPPRWCRNASRGRPAILPKLQGDRRGHLQSFLDSIQAKPGRLYVRHTLLPHGPYLYLPSGKQERPGWQDPIPGLNGPAGFGSQALTIHNGQRLRLQTGLVDRELGRLFTRLKKEGTFDQTLIAFLPDHGIATEQVGVKDRRTVTPSNIDEIAPIPLFIKAPGQRSGRIDRSWIRSIDVVPTIAHILRFKMPYKADGHPASSPVTRHRQDARMFKRDLSGAITVPASSMLRRRAALRRRELREYGYGDWASLYKSGGPHAKLVGLAPANLHPAGLGQPRASIINGSRMRFISARSNVIPAQVVGSIRGGTAGETRGLAVAVNGTIQAVTKSFYLRGSRKEDFAAMVPEQAFHPGANTVSVYEVSANGARLRLLGQA